MNYKVVLCLMVIIITYVVFGGVIFSHLEGPEEDQAKADIEAAIQEFSEQYSCVPKQDLQKLMSSLYKAYERGALTRDGTTSVTNWDYESSIFFAVTVITTIGYGNISPMTPGGRVFCVFFAMAGIPLFLIAASGIGHRLRLLGQKIRKITGSKLLRNKPQAQKTMTTIFLLLLGVLLMMLLPAVIFWTLEKWTFSDSVYYTYITLTTIGFGDYVAGADVDSPYRGVYRLCVAVWIILGLSWMAGLISTSQETFRELFDRARNRAVYQRHEDKHNFSEDNLLIETKWTKHRNHITPMYS